MYRKPFLQVIGPDGSDQVVTWGSKLIGVQLIDRAGYESDEAVFKFTRGLPYMAVPAEGTPYTVRVGWSADDVAVTGYYTFQRVHLLGNPRSGQQMHLVCRAGDFIDVLKRVDSEHFDQTNGHKTLGDVFRSLFKATGKAVAVAPEIDSRPIAGGYMLRWNQSPIDFATDLADDNGALVKPMGDKMVVMKRDAGQSGSGVNLSTILVRFQPNYEFDVELEPRFQYQEIAVPWFDKEQGRLQTETSKGSGSSSRDGLPHPAPSKDGATTLGEAVGQEWGRFTGQGYFLMPGDPTAVAEAPVKCAGFGSPIDDVDWQASGVTHDVIPDQGWTTTIEVETKPG